MATGDLIDYRNRSLHKGINSQIHGRGIEDVECTDLVNYDISIPLIRTKKPSPVSAVCLLTAPTLNTIVTATQVTLVLSWSLSAEPGDSTTIERSLDRLTWVSIGSVNYPGTTLTDAGLTPETTYYYRASAVAGCTSTPSSTVTGTTTTSSLTVGGAVPAGRICGAYTGTVTASGGTGPYTYAVTSGSLPTGLTMDGAGTITGTPTVTDVFAFTVTAFDSVGQGGFHAFSVTITELTTTLNIAISGTGTGLDGTWHLKKVLGCLNGYEFFADDLSGDPLILPFAAVNWDLGYGGWIFTYVNLMTHSLGSTDSPVGLSGTIYRFEVPYGAVAIS